MAEQPLDFVQFTRWAGRLVGCGQGILLEACTFHAGPAEALQACLDSRRTQVRLLRELAPDEALRLLGIVGVGRERPARLARKVSMSLCAGPPPISSDVPW
jgi:hypothetical protein